MQPNRLIVLFLISPLTFICDGIRAGISGSRLCDFIGRSNGRRQTTGGESNSPSPPA
jgi:hypothetical protein